MHPSLCLLIAWLLFATIDVLAQGLSIRSNPSFTDNRLPSPELQWKAGGNACPPDISFGDLPVVVTGDTCDFSDTVTSYGGDCTLIDDYPGEDRTYGIVLTEGNSVGFSLEMTGPDPGDLMLALLSQCGIGSSCKINSSDFIGAGVGPETIPESSYAPGTYYVNIDSFFPAGSQASCGPYTLTITGTNHPEPDLSIVLSASPDPVPAGGLLTHTLTVVNHSPFQATGVTVVDTLPAAVSLESTSAGCSATSADTVTCNVGVLQAFASEALTVTVRVDASATGSLFSTAEVSAAEPDPEPANNSDIETTPVTTAADLAIVKSDASDPVAAGENLTYALTVTNNGPSDATGISVTDALPPEVGFVSASSGCSHSGGEISCSFPDLSAGASTTRNLTVSVPATLDPQVTPALTNRASVHGGEDDPDLSNNFYDETTSVIRRADLAIAKLASSDPVVAGTDMTYTLTVNNLGPSPSTGGAVSDSLPPELSFVSSDDGCTADGATVSCPFGPISVGDSVLLSFVVDVDSSVTEPISNTATVTGNEEDPDPSNDTSEPVMTEVDTVVDLSVTKEDRPDPIRVDETLTYTIQVRNAGPSDARDVKAIDTLPEFVTWQSTTGCEEAIGESECVLGTIAAGKEKKYEIQVKVDQGASGQLLNEVRVETSSSGDVASATATTTVDTALLFSKKFSPNPVDVDAVSTLTFTIDNSSGIEPVESLAFLDQLIRELVIATPNGAVDNCNGTLIAPAGGQTITFSGGTVGDGSVCTVSVDVTSDTTGMYLNETTLISSAGNIGPVSDLLRVVPPVHLTKEFSPNTIARGGQSQLTFTIENTSDAAIVTMPWAPSSSTPMSAPVSCWIVLMTLPFGPITSPTLSSGIVIVDDLRRGLGDLFGRDSVIAPFITSMICQASVAGLGQRPRRTRRRGCRRSSCRAGGR